MKIALLDFDNTLYNGYSRYQTAAELEKRGVVAKGLTEEINELQEKYESGELTYNQKFAMDKVIFANYFQGLKVADLSKFTRTEFDLESNIFPWAQLLLTSLKNAGYLTVIISGSWNYIIEYAQELLDFDAYFATEFKVENGIIAPDFARIIDYEEKDKISKQLVADSEESIGIGDSTADFPFLSKTTHSFLLNPMPDAAEKAKATISHLQIVNEGNILKQVQDLLKEA